MWLSRADLVVLHFAGTILYFAEEVVLLYKGLQLGNEKNARAGV
tara:strand:+ start:323 stop:454 length:132 start_codon:yes stop_codon:yes gene_type:complete